MDYTTLGKTGLKVSVAGLGCGGNSRIGQGTGSSEAQSVALVREALDLGVNFLDTANAYETEGIVGKAIKGRPRDSVVISTKSHATLRRSRARQSRQLAQAARHRLRRHLPPAWAGARAPTTRRWPRSCRPCCARRRRASSATSPCRETGPRDPEHTMLARAVEEPVLGGVHAGLQHDASECARRSFCRGRARRASARCACLRCATSSPSRTC